ncbi:MotA/TolQ/ExbB proton channel family protein [Verrucomicrobia bacterium]|nr:MotA/TolQ/ExbB proton channel family protein [Verrucomicrobiota bacterium]
MRTFAFMAFVTLAFASMAMAAEGGIATDDENTMWGLIKKGGPVMIPLGIASILALALGLERFISLGKDRILPEAFVTEFGEAWGSDAKTAGEICEKYPNSAAHIFKAGLQWRKQGHEAVGKAMEDAAGREAEKIKRSVRPLSVIAGVCPLLGLLGTVYGMIDAFQKTADAGGAAKTSELADGIYQALISTAAGLTIAIPVLLLFQWLSSRADRAIDHIDESGTEFVVQHALSSTKGSASTNRRAPSKTKKTAQNKTEES